MTKGIQPAGKKICLNEEAFDHEMGHRMMAAAYSMYYEKDGRTLAETIESILTTWKDLQPSRPWVRIAKIVQPFIEDDLIENLSPKDLKRLKKFIP